MRHAFFDRYSRLASPIHRMPLSLKLGATIAILVTVVFAPISVQPVFFCVAGLLFIVALSSRIPFLHLVRRLLFLEIFVVGITILSLLQPRGMSIFSTLLAKSTLCLFTVVLFSGTTQITDLLRALRRWGTPDLMITVLALMYRYTFVMMDEMERMQRARTSRTFVGRRRDHWQSLSTVVAQLFIRSTERAERIYAAMCARGWK